MKRMFPLLLLATVASLVAVAGPASAADPKPVAPKSTGVPSDLLQQMGLAGMQPVSDQEGLSVRGKGLTFYKANLASVVNLNFGGAYIFQKINVYSKSGNQSYTNVTLP
jgi:hypothetical protein